MNSKNIVIGGEVEATGALADLPWAAEVVGGDSVVSVPGVLQYLDPSIHVRLVRQSLNGVPILAGNETGPDSYLFERGVFSEVTYGVMSKRFVNRRMLSAVAIADAPFETDQLARICLAQPYSEALVGYVEASRAMVRAAELADEFEDVLFRSSADSHHFDSLAIAEAVTSMRSAVTIDNEFVLDVAAKLQGIGISHIKYRTNTTAQFDSPWYDSILSVEEFASGAVVLGAASSTRGALQGASTLDRPEITQS